MNASNSHIEGGARQHSSERKDCRSHNPREMTTSQRYEIRVEASSGVRIEQANRGPQQKRGSDAIYFVEHGASRNGSSRAVNSPMQGRSVAEVRNP